MTKSFLFLLFLFGVGYSVGPQFMQALSRDGLKPMLLAVVMCLTGLAASIIVAKVLRLDPGFAAGLMSGALTQSAAMGTATDAVNGLALAAADRERFVAHIAVAAGGEPAMFVGSMGQHLVQDDLEAPRMRCLDQFADHGFGDRAECARDEDRFAGQVDGYHYVVNIMGLTS